MQPKRIAVIAISLVVGLAITAAIVYLRIPLAFGYHFGFGTTFVKFALSNVLLLILSFGGIAFIWLDYFMDTQFLKS